ncbi:hypothetical protein BD769DRAFT_1668784 [Suillus cothurnatus]|nr:hypothetical protein BD769DRAFT_1668784 [Suillus cothurnatus]
MSILYSADNFNVDGNFVSTRCFQDLLTKNKGLAGQVPSFNDINWDDPALYMMPLTSDEIAAVMSDNPKLPAPTPVMPMSNIAATNPFPELPDPSSHQPSKTRSLSPAPSPESSFGSTEPNMKHYLSLDTTTSTNRCTKASQKIHRDQKIERMKHLHDAVAEYLDEQKTKIEALLWAHHVTPKQINDISSSSQTHYHTSCKSQLIHALIHAKAKEINAGSRYSMAKLHEMKEAYITALEEHRERKVVGVQAHNLAAVQDVVAMMDRIVKELDDLQVRTSIYGTLFVIRGHINDIIQSAMHGTDNSEDFWEDVYEHSMADFLRQYKQWACTQNQNLNECDSLEAVRKQVCKMILQGLVAVTGKKDIMMNYSNYKMSVVEAYGVHLDALKAHMCYWAVQSPAEVKAHVSKLDTHRSSREAV